MDTLDYMYPSSGPPPNASVPPKPQAHGKHQAAAGGGTGAKKKTVQSNKQNFPLKLVMIGVLAVGLVVLIVAIVMVIPPGEDSSCLRLKEDKVKSAFDVNECAVFKKNCKFDVTTCTAPCPFGFTEEKGCAIDCTCASRGTFEGDVQFDDKSLPVLMNKYLDHIDNHSLDIFAGNTLSKDAKKWPVGSNGRIQIPFVYDGSLIYNAISVINKAADWLARWTCVDLKARKNNEKAYILFIQGDGCSSGIGMAGLRQQVSIGIDCDHISVVIHEVLHAMGFFHEQSRPDRDLYIEVFNKNIKPSKLHNYNKANPAVVADLNFEYDTRSLMHYTSRSFQIDWSHYTFIIRKTQQPIINGGIYPSKTDIAEIDKLYECSVKAANRKGGWGEFGEWSKCRATCGTAYAFRQRYRICQNPTGGHAQGCKGKNYERLECKLGNCKPTYSQWTQWTDCYHTCKGAGGAFRTRKRECTAKFELCPSTWIFGYDVYRREWCNQDIQCPVPEHVKKELKRLKEETKKALWTGWSHWYPLCPDPCDGTTTTTSDRLCLRHAFRSTDCPGVYAKTISKGEQRRRKFCQCGYGVTPPNGRVPSKTSVLYRRKRLIGNFTTWADLLEGETPFLCLNGRKVIGKFDGDDFKDMICLRHNSIQLFSGTKLGIQHGFSLDENLEFCNTNQHTLLREAADINGDGIDDVACIDRNTGQIKILTLVENRIVIRADWAALQDFCVGDDLNLAAQPVHSDTRADLICEDSLRKSETFAVNTWNL